MELATQTTSLESMAEKVIAYYTQRDFSPQYIQRFRRHVERIRQFLTEKGFSDYSATECELFIREIIGDGEYKHLSTDDKSAIRCANILIEYHLTGMISYRIKNTRDLLHGRIGEGIQSFLEYRKAGGYSPDTISDDRIYLGRFQKYLDAVGRTDFPDQRPQASVRSLLSYTLWEALLLFCSYPSAPGTTSQRQGCLPVLGTVKTLAENRACSEW